MNTNVSQGVCDGSGPSHAYTNQSSRGRDQPSLKVGEAIRRANIARLRFKLRKLERRIQLDVCDQALSAEIDATAVAIQETFRGYSLYMDIARRAAGHPSMERMDDAGGVR